MDRTTRAVKPKRPYDSSRRREQARRRRDRVLDVAERLLLSHGYGEVTVATIARAAGVSAETIYKSFGGKPGLVRAMWLRGLAGAGPTPAWERSDEMMRTARDPRRVIRSWGNFQTEVAPRTAPILLLIRTAAGSDPRLAALLEEVERQALSRMEHNARALLERGWLRPGVGLEQARDILWTYSSAELYELLVVRRRWPVQRYAAFAAEGMIAALLPPVVTP